MPPLRPIRRHTTLALTLVVALTAGLFFLVPIGPAGWRLFGAYLVAISLTTFGYYGYDKARARTGGSRVPEVVLHGLALAGGTVGAWLGMNAFRHKTIKGPFRILFWTIAIMQLGVVVAVVYRLAK